MSEAVERGQAAIGQADRMRMLAIREALNRRDDGLRDQLSREIKIVANRVAQLSDRVGEVDAKEHVVLLDVGPLVEAVDRMAAAMEAVVKDCSRRTEKIVSAVIESNAEAVLALKELASSISLMPQPVIKPRVRVEAPVTVERVTVDAPAEMPDAKPRKPWIIRHSDGSASEVFEQ